MEWQVHLSKRNPEKVAGIALAAVIAAVGGWLLLRSPLFAVLGLIFILGSTTDFWLPMRYRLDEKGASLKCGVSMSAIEWPNVKSVMETTDGVKLSPLAGEGKSRLEAFRGVFLRFENNRDEVLAKIRSHMEEQCSISGKTI